MAKVRIGEKIVRIGDDDYKPSVQEIEEVADKLGLSKPKEDSSLDDEVAGIKQQRRSETLEGAKKAFDFLASKIPLSDRIKQAALVGRGVEAVEKGLKIEDAPFLAAKTASGALQGGPEFIANRPMAGPIETVPKAMGITKSPDLFPKPATKEGEKLGGQLGIAASFATALAPIKEKSVAERITKAAAEKMKGSRETVANATKKIVEFDSKVRSEFFAARVKAGSAFDDSLKALQKTQPDQRIDLRSALEGLGVEVDESGQVMGSNPKLMSDLKAVFRRSGNKTLEKLLTDPAAAENLTLEQTQDIVKSIKKIPSLAQKLNQGKFAQYTDTDIPVLQFIEDVRDAQLSAFPEFSKTLDAYRKTMHKFRALKPYFGEGNLIKNMLNDFQGKPVIQKFVRDLLPKNIVGEIESVRKVSKAMRLGKEVAKETIRYGVPFVGAAGVARALISD